MNGSSILVTGGTGSFGNAFISHVLRTYKPRRLIIYSRDEFKQYVMQQKFSDQSLRFFVGDVRDADRLSFAMREVDYVFHAAAMKQVVTAEYNPIECINTNIIGAENVIRVALRSNVKKVMGVSTDKAVSPINLYGATKACMERLFIAANHLAGSSGPRFSIVRYGNVIGSRGSVIPVFMKQRASGRLTITDPRMTRFWLRIEDGVSFVDDCTKIMHGGEIFVKKVPSMRVTDLARAIGPDCEIVETGIRPGEKLHESMVSSEESLYCMEFKDKYVILPSIKMWDSEPLSDFFATEGKPVAQGFSYSSDNNTEWLETGALRDLIERTEVVSE